MNYSSRAQRWFYHRAPYAVRCGVATAYGLAQRRKRYGAHFRCYRAELEESQWLDGDALEELQAERVRDFLVYARDHSEFHRRRFADAGFNPESYREPGDLARLPLLTKSDVRANLETLISDETGSLRVTWTHTSGTTGQGLRFPESIESFQREYAFRVQSYEWAGAEFRARWAFCAGHPVARTDADRPPFWVRDLANNWMLMSSYHLAEAHLPAYIEALRRFDPQLLSGYPSSLFLLAVANRAAGSPVRPASVVTSSETLFESQRVVMEESFGCRVYSFYGNAERAGALSQCPEGHFHVRSEHSLVEVLDDEGKPVGPGGEGRLVATAFGNRATPLVRYVVGDVIVLSERESCPCGRGGVLVDRVLGRMEDYVVTPGGRIVGRLDHLFKDSVNVRLAQVVQDRVDEVVIRVVRESDYDDSDERIILEEARLRLGSDVNIRFDYVASIPRTKNGKHRFVLSSIARPTIMGLEAPTIEPGERENAQRESGQ